MPSRRDVLRLLGLGAAGLALDPERRLWVQGRKTYIIPAPRPALAADLSDVLSDGRWHYVTIDEKGQVWSLDGVVAEPIGGHWPPGVFMAKTSQAIMAGDPWMVKKGRMPVPLMP